MARYNRTTTKKKSRKAFWIIPLIILVGLITIWFLVIRDDTASNVVDTSADEQVSEETINYDPPTTEEKAETDANQDKTKVADPEPQPTTNNTGSVKIVKVWQTSGSDVVVQSALYGTSWETCKVTFKKSTQSLSREAPVIYQPDYSTCEGFTIKGSDFPESGTWSVTLTGTKTNGTSLTSSAKKVSVRIEP